MSIPRPQVPQQLVEAMQRLRAPVMITHVVPDADALGAACATALAWASDRCRPVLSLPDGSLSQRLEFMLDWANLPRATSGDFAAADGFVVLDTAKRQRCNVAPELKETDWPAGRPVLNIDHHQTNTGFGDVNWIVEAAGSTCELVYYFLRAGGRPISSKTASLLYAGIVTDTIGFSLGTTNAAAMAAAAELIACGADVAELGERLFRSQRKSEFDLLRVIYDNTKVLADGELAYSSASYSEIHEAGCNAADIDDQINIPRSLYGVRLAMLFTEGDKGKTRINFRGSGNVTIVDLAREYGGGGHPHAAGAILDCGLKEAIKQVVPRAIEHLKRFQS